MRMSALRNSAITAIAAATLVLSGCSATPETATPKQSSAGATDAGSDTDAQATADAQWPRTFTNADGTTTEILEQPERIASTSVTVTGSLLAIEAPVVASGSAGNGNFFAQWDAIAQERGVQNLWSAGSVDLEALYGQEPDLIVVSVTGADSVLDQVADLNEIAPTIVVDYGGQTWQELATELGTATGLETQAEQTVTGFDEYVAQAKDQITIPDGSVNIVSFNGTGEDNPIARVGSAQASVLTGLGFTIEDPDIAWHTQAEPRADFVWATYENLSNLTAETTFILSQDDAGAQGFAQDPILANLPSVANEQVYGLGVNSFRIDLFSATEIVDTVAATFGN